jgi:hypothetical protein
VSVTIDEREEFGAWVKSEGDRCIVERAIDPHHFRPPAELAPKYWEPLRIRLQEIYRRATGETQATITVENQP